MNSGNKTLEDHHITVINVGGRYFDHFLNLFDSSNTNTIPKKIACLTDRDPERKEKAGGGYNKCYPFEYNQDAVQFDYRDNATEKIAKYATHTNIHFFSQDAEKGKTFEYDLILSNPSLELLITDAMSNQGEIKDLMQLYRDNKPISEYEPKLRGSEENKRIKDGITANTTWLEKDKKKAIIAARYLNSVGKGENALELAYALKENREKETPVSFNVPDYIKDAIEWICQ